MRSLTFQFAVGKETLGTARQNQVNADRLYEVAGAKRKMGQISENELLQLKLVALKARAAVTDAESNLNAHMFRLRSFLAIGNDLILEPVVPESAPQPKDGIQPSAEQSTGTQFVCPQYSSSSVRGRI